MCLFSMYNTSIPNAATTSKATNSFDLDICHSHACFVADWT